MKRVDSTPRERKAFPALATKVVNEQGLVEHVVAVTGNIDLGLDRIEPGAFNKTLKERGERIRVLDQHNTDSVLRVLGKPVAVREVDASELPAEVVKSFPDAKGGLLVQTQFILDNQAGREAFNLVKAGAIDEWSIGFDPTEVAYERATIEGKNVTLRVIKQLKLYEYSPVLWGMNPATTTISAKGKGEEVKDKAPNAGEKATKELGMDGQPVRRLADMLRGEVHRTCALMADQWLIDGLMSPDQHSRMMGALDDALNLLCQSMPAEMAALEVSPFSFFDLWAHQPALESKEHKAGRRISAASAAAIQSAIDSLSALLSEDTEGADAESESDDKGCSTPKKPKPKEDGEAKAGPGATPPPASKGPDATPPTTNLLALIEAELAQNEILLVEA